MKVTQQTYADNPVLHEHLKKVTDALTNRLTFTDNIAGETITFTSDSVTNVEDEITHHLSKVPQGYLVMSQNKACSIYKGTTAWTSSKIYLMTSNASVEIKIFVF